MGGRISKIENKIGTQWQKKTKAEYRNTQLIFE